MEVSTRFYLTKVIQNTKLTCQNLKFKRYCLRHHFDKHLHNVQQLSAAPNIQRNKIIFFEKTPREQLSLWRTSKHSTGYLALTQVARVQFPVTEFCIFSCLLLVKRKKKTNLTKLKLGSAITLLNWLGWKSFIKQGPHKIGN